MHPAGSTKKQPGTWNQTKTHQLQETNLLNLLLTLGNCMHCDNRHRGREPHPPAGSTSSDSCYAQTCWHICLLMPPEASTHCEPMHLYVTSLLHGYVVGPPFQGPQASLGWHLLSHRSSLEYDEALRKIAGGTVPPSLLFDRDRYDRESCPMPCGMSPSRLLYIGQV